MRIFDWIDRGGFERVIVASVAIMAVVLLAIIWPANLIRMGVVTEFEGTVQLVNRNNFIMPKTYVVLQTYAGENDEFTLAGYHHFEIGEKYRIKYVNKLYVFGLCLYGDLQEAEVTT